MWRVASTMTRIFVAEIGMRLGRGASFRAQSLAGRGSVLATLHGGSRNLQLFRDILARHSVGGYGHNLGALNDSQGKAFRMCPCGQRRAFCGRQENRWSQMHETEDSSRRS